MKKLLLKALLSCVVIGALAFALVGCNQPDTKDTIFKTSKDIYAFAGFTGTELLGTSQSSAQTFSNSGISNVAMGSQSSISDEKLAEINKYLNIFEGMLAGGEPIKTTVTNDVEYNGVMYGVKMAVETTNIDGSVVLKTMFYNEFKVVDGEEVEVGAEDQEIETTLVGVMVDGENVYDVEGRKEIEEDEMEITFVATDADGNTITIEQEIEAGEQEYVYTLKNSNGRLISKSEIEFEVEDNEVEIELKVIENGNREIYKFKKEVNGNLSTIKMHYTVDGKVQVATIRIIEDENGELQYEYNFSSGHKKQLKRNCQKNK